MYFSGLFETKPKTYHHVKVTAYVQLHQITWNNLHPVKVNLYSCH